MPTRMTLRGVPDELASRLRSLAKARGESLNSTLLRILEDAVGMNGRRSRLERYATWTKEDLAEFEEVLGAQRRVEDDLWR
jgi:plasmid stability protein